MCDQPLEGLGMWTMPRLEDFAVEHGMIRIENEPKAFLLDRIYRAHGREYKHVREVKDHLLGTLQKERALAQAITDPHKKKKRSEYLETRQWRERLEKPKK